MEFDELLITTGVDALVRLVKEKQRIELEDAASVLNIPQETLEDWARVLEEEGILRLEYRLTRIYFVWVKPTAEEVAGEKESFYEEKRGLEAEVESFRKKIGDETGELEDLRRSFGDFYSKVYGRMGELEKIVSSIPASKTISDDMLSKYEDELSQMESRLSEARSGIEVIRGDISALGIERGAGQAGELMARIESMSGDLAGLGDEMAILRKRASSQEVGGEVSMPTLKDIKKKFESMQKDFTSLRSKNAQMRQDMLSLHESSEILKSVAESIMGQEDKIGALRNEVVSLSEEAEKLSQRTASVTSKVKQNAELVERLGDSVDVAKNILKKFPSQEKVLEEIRKLQAEEDSIADKTADMEKLLEAVGGRQVTAKQFGEMLKKMEDKSAQMKKDMDALESALQDEKSTYLTFQKIKERIVPSIETYEQQLGDMEKRIARIREESAAQIRGIKDDAKTLQESLRGGQVQDIVKVAEEIRGKKKSMEEIRAAFEDLMTTSDNLSKRITLLSREAKLLEIRTGGGGGAPAPGGGEGGGGPIEEKGVRKKLELTQEEEIEFRRKREELKKLIQRLWEQ